jgi:hypothetical protein
LIKRAIRFAEFFSYSFAIRARRRKREKKINDIEREVED